MIEYKFTIATVPDDKSGYHLPAYTEGPLEVVLGGRRFVRVEEALLVEFAIVLSKWLRNQPSDLYYSSMDFEEEPIFALKQKNGVLEPSSVWASGESVDINPDEAFAAAYRYVEDLAVQLRRHGAELDRVIEEAIAADC